MRWWRWIFVVSRRADPRILASDATAVALLLWAPIMLARGQVAGLLVGLVCAAWLLGRAAFVRPHLRAAHRIDESDRITVFVKVANGPRAETAMFDGCEVVVAVHGAETELRAIVRKNHRQALRAGEAGSRDLEPLDLNEWPSIRIGDHLDLRSPALEASAHVEDVYRHV